jgi:hypothetical protein
MNTLSTGAALMTAGATMEKSETKSIKISKAVWQQLKFISLVDGDDISDLATDLLGPALAKRYKAAKAKFDAREKEGGDE